MICFVGPALLGGRNGLALFDQEYFDHDIEARHFHRSGR